MTKSSWAPIPKPTPPKCDICNRRARWKHPAGGFRCNDCPRPEETQK